MPLSASARVLNFMIAPRRFVLARQELQPHVVTAIVHEQEEVPLTTVCGWHDWPTEIAVDELENVRRPILGRL